MKIRSLPLLLCGLLLLILACEEPSDEIADTIFINGNIYTVNPENPSAEAIAVSEERIIAIGTTAEVEKYKGETTEVIDLEGQFTMPGFIEGHGHFSGLGQSLINLNFLKAKSWSEIVAAVAVSRQRSRTGRMDRRPGLAPGKMDRRIGSAGIGLSLSL